jgi:PAS domain S-box-containing protein
MQEMSSSAYPGGPTGSQSFRALSFWNYKRARRDLLILLILAGALLVESHTLDLDDQFDDWARGHVWLGIHLDELVLVSSIMFFGLAVFSFRRWRELRDEVNGRQSAETALNTSESKYRVLVEQSPDAIITSDGLLNVQFASKAACEMLGYTNSEFQRLNIANTYIPLERDIAVPRSRELAVGKTLCFERNVLRKDGTYFPAEVILRRVEVQLYQAIIRDITERNRLQQQLLQSQKVEAVGRLAGGVAHDFNNILTTMIGYCELLRDQLGTGSDARANVEEIAAAAERAASLTRQLLAFSRKQTLQPKVLDLNAVVRNMDNMLRRLIGEDIEFITKLAPDIGSVKADPGQIEQVFMNLAVNGRDAMPNGGKLIVETANTILPEEYTRLHEDVKPGDYVMIAVTDTGSGMTDEVKGRLFEPFFTTKPQGQGTGLGLATCYGVVKQSGGHITVYSEVDHGTTFKVYLPRISERASSVSTAPSTPVASGGGETILLVEDDHAVRGLNARLLRAKGYTVIEAANGREALRVVDQRQVNSVKLLLTDVIMPEMGGKELAQHFRAVHPNTKVLFCSGYTQEAIDRGGELEPGTAFLQKPFTPMLLASKIREVLDNQAT